MEEQPKCRLVHKKKHKPFFPDIQHHRGQLRDAGHNYHLTQSEVYSHLTELNDVAALLGSAGLRRPWSHIHCDCDGQLFLRQMFDRPALEFPVPVPRHPRFDAPGAERYLRSHNYAAEEGQPVGPTEVARRAPRKKKKHRKFPLHPSPTQLVSEKAHVVLGQRLPQGQSTARRIRTPKALRRAKKMLGRKAPGFTRVPTSPGLT